MNSAADVWSKVLHILSGELTSTALTTWFDDCQAVEISDNRLVLYTPSDFKKEVIEGRFLGSVKNALKELFSGDFDVLVLGEGGIDHFNGKGAGGNNSLEEYTFERFVVGNSINLPMPRPRRWQRVRSKTSTPCLFMVIPASVKPHLLHAIRHAVSKKHPEYNIVYVKATILQTSSFTPFRWVKMWSSAKNTA
jgi:chromosomal replication initiator protein